jgi:hypothetical protein
MSPLGFTDDEMDSLTTLASALPPAARDGFFGPLRPCGPRLASASTQPHPPAEP